MIHLHNIDESKAAALAHGIADSLSATAKRYERATSSLSALYQIITTKHGMNLQIYVGDQAQTVWVQNFELPTCFAKLAFAVNEPERTSATSASSAYTRRNEDYQKSRADSEYFSARSALAATASI